MLTEKKYRMDVCGDYSNEGIEMITKCGDCKYHLCSSFKGSCDGCPMTYDSPFSIHHCHCCAYITHDELKQKKCKFYKPKEQEG